MVKNILIFFKKNILTSEYFKYVFIIFTIAISIPIVHDYIGSYAKIAAMWGVFIIFYDIVADKLYFKRTHIKYLYIFILCYMLSVFFNHGFFFNFKVFIYTIIPLLVFYFDYLRYDSVAACIREIKKVCVFFIGITFITSFISISMYLTNFWFKDGTRVVGFYLGRLYGIYVSPNAGGIIALISLVLSIIIIRIYNSVNSRSFSLIFKTFAATNILLQLIFISLTDSKGTLLTFVFLFFVLTFLYFIFINKRVSSLNWVMRNFLSFSIAIVVCVTCFLLLNVIGYLFSYMPSIIANISDKESLSYITSNKNEYDNPIYVKQILETPSQDITFQNNIERNVQVSVQRTPAKRRYVDPESASYRFVIWRIGLNIIIDRPVFGVGLQNITYEADRINTIKNLGFDDFAVHKTSSGMHNVFMQTAVASGIITLVFLVIFLFVNIKYIIYRLAKKQMEEKIIVIVIFSLILSLLFGNIYECTILYSQTAIESLFWLFLGYLVGLCSFNTELSEGQE